MIEVTDRDEQVHLYLNGEATRIDDIGILVVLGPDESVIARFHGHAWQHANVVTEPPKRVTVLVDGKDVEYALIPVDGPNRSVTETAGPFSRTKGEAAVREGSEL